MSADECDTVIVGGGAAGAILAARLSEDPAHRVVLIEAGRDLQPGNVPQDIQDTFPTAYSNPAYFWPGLKATARQGAPQTGFSQARVMGGGSSVMGMWGLRGIPRDYDVWRDAGAVGWAWDDVLPYFNKLERDLDFSGPMHGSDGPIVMRRHVPSTWPSFTLALAAAAAMHGLPLREDINSDFRDGIFPVPVTNDDNGRISSASGYLTTTVRQRKNLVVMTETEVTRIIFSGRKATGVQFAAPSGELTLRCQEVILSAGAIGSPALLLGSGIGSGNQLRELGIEPLLDLPGVGANLQNHCIVNFATRMKPSARQARQLRTYGLACARLSSNHPQGSPGDLHLQFVTRSSLNPHGDHLGIVGAALYSPHSRGSVSLASPDLSVPPRIDFRLLEHASDRERMQIAAGYAMNFLADPAVGKLRDSVFTVVPSSLVRILNKPGLPNKLASGLLANALDGPAPLRAMLATMAGRKISETSLQHGDCSEALSDVSPIFHPCGTCAIGRDSDPDAVVDSACSVRGVEGLRVVDASIMPTIPTGNTCLPTMMIAERASDLIRTARQ